MIFLGQHYNMESWIMNFWGNIVSNEEEKKGNNKQIHFSGQSFILHQAQTEAIFIFFLKGIVFIYH